MNKKYLPFLAVLVAVLIPAVWPTPVVSFLGHYDIKRFGPWYRTGCWAIPDSEPWEPVPVDYEGIGYSSYLVAFHTWHLCKQHSETAGGKSMGELYIGWYPERMDSPGVRIMVGWAKESPSSPLLGELYVFGLPSRADGPQYYWWPLFR